MKIFKYTLAITDHQTVSLPSGYKILSVGNQREELVLWALVPTTNVPHVAVLIWIHGTGNSILPGESEKYIGTVQMGNGLVWHVFEGK